MKTLRAIVTLFIAALAATAFAQDAPSRLDAVQKAGKLRVCTPGDYKWQVQESASSGSNSNWVAFSISSPAFIVTADGGVECWIPPLDAGTPDAGADAGSGSGVPDGGGPDAGELDAGATAVGPDAGVGDGGAAAA